MSTRFAHPPATTVVGQLWNTGDAAALAGVTVRQTDDWTREGIITPELQAHLQHGQGRHRWWTSADVTRLRVLGELSGLRCPKEAMARASEAVTASGIPIRSDTTEWLFVPAEGPAIIADFDRVDRRRINGAWVIELAACATSDNDAVAQTA